MDAQNDFHLPDAGILDDMHLTHGVTYAVESTNISYISNSAYGPYNQFAHAVEGQTGLFEQMQGRVLKRVDVTAGLREDFPDLYADRTTGKVGAVLQLPEISGRVKSSYGTSYRIPSLFERYGIDSSGLVGNSALRPERAQSWEAGIEKDIPLKDNRRFATIGSTYFETTTKNLIQYNSGAITQYQNVALAQINGVETQIKLRPLYWLEATTNWTSLNAINASGQTFGSTPPNEQLLRRPHNVANGSVTVWVTPEWRVTPQMRYTGAAYDALYDNTGAWAGRGRVGGYSLVDLSSDYAVTDQATVYGHIQNLLNRTVETPNGYRQEGFAFLVGLRYRE